jgi:Domain of unknown function (DUF4136)
LQARNNGPRFAISLGMKILLSLSLLLLLAACTSTAVQTKVGTASLQAHETFSVDQASITPPDGFRAGDLDAFPLVVSAIAHGLTNKGYQPAPSGSADWIVTVREGIKTTAPATTEYLGYGPEAGAQEVAVDNTVVVKLVVSLRDRETGEAAWECIYDGPAKRFVGSLDRKIRKAVERCLDELPAREA